MMSATAMSATHATIDARPVRPVSDGTLWDVAIRRRDEIETIIRRILEDEHIEALVIASSTGNYPPWVRLEAWMPASKRLLNDGTESERVLLEFVIDLKLYHEHEIVTTASLWRGKDQTSISERPKFQVSDCAEWVRYALRLGPKPSNYRPRRDAWLRVAHFFLPLIPAPHRNRIRRGFKTSGIPLLAALFLFGVLLLVGSTPAAAISPVLTLFMAIGGIAATVSALIVGARRQEVVAINDQPAAPPRNLGLLDSWHAVVAGLGTDYEAVKSRLIKAVAQDHLPEIECASEVYGYRTPNGYEERERLVISKGQSMVLLHISPFGNDVFVGWQASLNYSKWDETKTISTRMNGSKIIRFVDIRPAVYQPSQFDLIDLNSLSELVHRRLEREIKAILKEKAIDQEIDFQIIRGSRDNALADGGGVGKSEKKKAGWRYS